jgi:hypothetical protein
MHFDKCNADEAEQLVQVLRSLQVKQLVFVGSVVQTKHEPALVSENVPLGQVPRQEVPLRKVPAVQVRQVLGEEEQVAQLEVHCTHCNPSETRGMVQAVTQDPRSSSLGLEQVRQAVVWTAQVAQGEEQGRQSSWYRSHRD